ncbi:MAG TPA: hypothetical protein PKA63_07370 [Oligoflexia bacterium]|nr:hypothetical protein [Oligoflexia bacterium]HMP48469.1 hypothetical protein [Oligoflexia bacterium]
MELIYRLILFISLISLAGCWSSYKREITYSSFSQPLSGTYGTVFIHECSLSNATLTPRDCSYYRGLLISLINSTKVFDEISNNPSDKSDYEIKILETPKLSYIGHFPLTYLITVAIPLWSKEQYGYLLEFTNNQTGVKIIIDSREEGTVITWILAPIFNIFPNRVMERRLPDEIQDMRNRILNSLNRI